MTTIKNAVLMIGLSAIAAFSAPALAADAPAVPATTGTTFGIVDMNKVLSTTDAAKDIFSQMDVKRKEYLAQLSKEEDSLHAFQQEVEKEKATLSKAAFEEKGKVFEEKYQQLQKNGQSRKEILDRAGEGAMNKLREKAAEIVAEVAKQRHYSAVFTQNAVMMSTPDLDLTDIVIAQLNKTVKSIPVDWAAATAATNGKKK